MIKPTKITSPPAFSSRILVSHIVVRRLSSVLGTRRKSRTTSGTVIRLWRQHWRWPNKYCLESCDSSPLQKLSSSNNHLSIFELTATNQWQQHLLLPPFSTHPSHLNPQYLLHQDHAHKLCLCLFASQLQSTSTPGPWRRAAREPTALKQHSHALLYLFYSKLCLPSSVRFPLPYSELGRGFTKINGKLEVIKS